MMTPIERRWTTEAGLPDGAVSTGIGYTIAWQRGALDKNGRNGAFLIEILGACIAQLEAHQEGLFQCEENAIALDHLNQARSTLMDRASKRQAAGTLGTHAK